MKTNEFLAITKVRKIHLKMPHGMISPLKLKGHHPDSQSAPSKDSEATKNRCVEANSR